MPAFALLSLFSCPSSLPRLPPLSFLPWGSLCPCPRTSCLFHYAPSFPAFSPSPLPQGSPCLSLPTSPLPCPTPLTLQTLTLPGYAVTIDNGTFTWAQDLPPTLHRYQLLPSLLAA